MGRHELIVSRVGYVTSQRTFEVNDSTALTFNVRLVGITLKEISVTAKKDKQWENQLKRFNVLFFGKNVQQRQCTILNPWVLEFSEDATGRFSANASSNLIIDNLGLGYKVLYQLKKFEYTPSNYSILGVAWFQEIPTYDTALLDLWIRERRKVYFGSATNLLASLTRKSLQKDGFELYQDITNSPEVVRKSSFTANLNSSIAPLDINNLVKKGHNSDQFFLNLPSKMEVHYIKGRSIPIIYRNVAVPISWIEIKKGSILEVNGSGVLMNPAVMTLSGAMSEPKIADLLPMNYSPGAADSQPVITNAETETQYLLERTHVHTDKTYYYSGERLWFKCYMKYISRAYQDSLSNVLYLDLVDKNNVVVVSKLLLIDTLGAAIGSIDLSKVGPGAYQLRSTTRWMLNYDKSFIFTKTIGILEDDEVVVKRQIDTLSSLRAFVGTTDRASYRRGDTVAMTIPTHDNDGSAVACNLSVSVAPWTYSSLGKEAPDIYTKLSFSDQAISTPASQSHSIQYGIDIKGTAEIKRQKKKSGGPMVLLAQEGTADIINTRAARDGSFSINSLQLYDTMKLSMQAISLKGNRRGLIKIDSAEKILIPPMPFTALTDEIVKAEIPRRPVAPELSGPVQILKEVVIESDGPRKVVGSATHLTADVVVTGEDLRNADSGDLLGMLQSKVSGLRIATFIDNGVVRKYFKLGGSFTFDKNPLHHEPVVLIDGSVISNQGGETAAEQVSRLTASMIDRIEVIKFGNGAAYGARGANGVIAIYTRTDSYKRKVLDPLDRSLFTPIRVKGYSTTTTFKDYPSYPTGATIYWNPSVTLRAGGERTLKFLIPDVRGKYAIHVEGLSADGRPLKAVCLIDITD